LPKKTQFVIALALWLVLAGVPLAKAKGNADKGKEIFNEVCIRCHTTDKAGKLGPGLQGITKRRDIAWIEKWITSPQDLIASGDLYAKRLREENKYGITMPTLPVMQKASNRADIIAFLKTL